MVWWRTVSYTHLDVYKRQEQLGVLICGREKEEFAVEGQLLVEYAATLASVMMIRAASRKAETEARKKNVVQLALEVLSYSELEAVKYIFNEIEGNEGLSLIHIFMGEVDYLALLREKLPDYEVFPISAATGEGLKPLVYRLAELVEQVELEPEETTTCLLYTSRCV